MYIAGEIREIINSVLIVVTGIALIIKYVHVATVYSLFSVDFFDDEWSIVTRFVAQCTIQCFLRFW